MGTDKQKLSPIETELLECYKNHQPVLLYGEDKIGRKELILNVHKANGGLDQRREVYKEEYGIPLSERTVRTWDNINLAYYDNADIYDLLAFCDDDPETAHLYEMDERFTGEEEGYFYCCEGMLFLDNLLCTDENKQIYNKLAAEIENGSTSYNWLVVYTHNPNDLPPYFMEQFKPIPLDSEGEERKKVEGKLKCLVPNDTKWTDINMSLTDKEHKTLDISIKGGKPFTVNCREMGLESQHSHKPLRAWWVLMAFAKAENNEIPSTGKQLAEFAKSVNNIIATNGQTLFSHIDILRKKLSENFRISENPIPHFDEEGVYNTLFRIKDKSYTEEHETSLQKRKNVECAGCGELIEKYTRNNVDDKGSIICDKCRGTRDDRLSKENVYDNYPEEDEWN